MSSLQLSPAFLRYLKARLKPFTNSFLWVPPTILALLAVFIWQYHKHPEWLNTALNRPKISPSATSQVPSNSAVNGESAALTKSRFRDWDLFLSALDGKNSKETKTDLLTGRKLIKSPDGDKPADKSLFDQMQEKQKDQTNPIFAPLIPNNNPNSDLLDRAALRDNRSLLQGSPQGTNSSNSNPKATSQPDQPSSLPKSRTNSGRNTEFSNVLQQAVDRIFGNSATNPSQTKSPTPTNSNLNEPGPTTANRSRQTTYPTDVPSTANRYAAPPRQVAVPNNSNNPPSYLGQRGVNPSVNPLPNNVPPPAIPNFNQVNQPTGINRAYSPTNPGLQSLPTSPQPNNYNSLSNPNPYGIQSPQIKTPNIRQPIQVDSPGY